MKMCSLWEVLSWRGWPGNISPKKPESPGIHKELPPPHEPMLPAAGVLCVFRNLVAVYALKRRKKLDNTRKMNVYWKKVF
jgi:hypothetical protein